MYRVLFVLLAPSGHVVGIPGVDVAAVAVAAGAGAVGAIASLDVVGAAGAGAHLAHGSNWIGQRSSNYRPCCRGGRGGCLRLRLPMFRFDLLSLVPPLEPLSINQTDNWYRVVR